MLEVGTINHTPIKGATYNLIPARASDVNNDAGQTHEQAADPHPRVENPKRSHGLGINLVTFPTGSGAAVEELSMVSPTRVRATSDPPTPGIGYMKTGGVSFLPCLYLRDLF